MPARLMIGPGPSMISPRVYDALARPIMSFDDPEFINIIDNVCKNLRRLFNTSNKYTFPIAGTGTYGMEFLLRNCINATDHVLVISAGYFGERLADMAAICKPAKLNIIKESNPDVIAADIKKLPMPPTVICFVHAETSRLQLNHAAAIVAACKKYNKPFVIMDAVSSLGGVPVNIDEWNVDACFSATQKCISAPPGLALITMNDRFVKKCALNQSGTNRSFCYDIDKNYGYWVDTAHKYFYTVPINIVYALNEALNMMFEEGIDNVHKRHTNVGQHAQIELSAIEMTKAITNRIPYMNALVRVSGSQSLKQQLLTTYGIQVGGPLGLDEYRIGWMGESARVENVDKLINAIRALMAQ